MNWLRVAEKDGVHEYPEVVGEGTGLLPPTLPACPFPGPSRRKMSEDLGTCTMCEQAPATTHYGFPVCQPCCDGLIALDADLKQMEAQDPELARLGRAVEESWEKLLRKRSP